MCASNAPTPTRTSVDMPSFLAHSGDRFPAAISEVYVLSNNRDVKPSKMLSREVKNSFGGSPLKSADHNALWPALQIPLFIFDTSFPPVNRKGIQSQCSAKE